MKRFSLLLLFAGFPLIVLAQTPEIFDVSEVVAGAQRLDTKYFLAVGKWSDDPKELGTLSTEVHCYERFGLCEMARATWVDSTVGVVLDSFDILRWDRQELIAIDSSPICIVNTVRADFVTKKVSISSTSKGVKGNKICSAIDADPSALKTAFLTGLDDELKNTRDSPDKKRQ